MKKAQKVCYIAGAGDSRKTCFTPREQDLVIAADGGFDLLNRLNIEPDYILGDFDSIHDLPRSSAKVMQFPAEKDDTDMMLAVKFALAKGCDTFVIYGGMGNRLDHTLANVQGLVYLAHHGARGYLVGMGTVITAITNSQIAFAGDKRGYLSVFCHDASASGVTLRGLKYPLTDASLTNDDPLGVSNQFLGVPSVISVKKGTLVVVWYEDHFTLESLVEPME